VLLLLLPAGNGRSEGCAPPQDFMNHPTKPRMLSACKLAEPQTVQASPLRLQSNGRTLRQVVSRLIQSSAATILPSDFEEETEPKGTGSAVFGGACPAPRPPPLLPLLPAPWWARPHAQSSLAQKLAPFRPMVERSVEQSMPHAGSRSRDFAMAILSMALIHASAAAGCVEGTGSASWKDLLRQTR
jgi:hypothetical protein